MAHSAMQGTPVLRQEERSPVDEVVSLCDKVIMICDRSIMDVSAAYYELITREQSVSVSHISLCACVCARRCSTGVVKATAEPAALSLSRSLLFWAARALGILIPPKAHLQHCEN